MVLIYKLITVVMNRLHPLHQRLILKIGEIKRFLTVYKALIAGGLYTHVAYIVDMSVHAL